MAPPVLMIAADVDPGLASLDPALIGWLVESLRPYRSVVLPVFFVGFFLAALVALLRHENDWVRRAFVLGFFLMFLVVNLTQVPMVSPMARWHKFSEPYDQAQVIHQMRVVDATGRELYFDDRSTLATEGHSLGYFHDDFRAEYSPAEQREIAAWFLERARNRRAFLERSSPWHALRFLRFPPHDVVDSWRRVDLTRFDRFVGVRIYRVRVETAETGGTITEVSERLVFEYVEVDPTGVNESTAQSTTGPHLAPVPG